MIKNQTQSTFASVDMNKFYAFMFPIPPLPIQEEIVCILDKFTSLTAELTARRKQYEYYRDELLTRETKVERFKIKDLFDTRNGYTPSTSNSDFWDNGTVPWFVMEDIRENGRVLSDSKQHITESAVKKSGLFPANSIIVATSATIGEHALITSDFLCNQRFTCLSPKTEYKSKIDMKYMFYYAFKLDEFCKRNTTKSSFASVDMGKFYDFEFPLPPLDVQQRIVNVLDNFDSICTDLKIGLPAEIEARKKQYEYYRDLLLTFSSSGNTIFTEQNRTEQNRTEQNRTDEIKLLHYVFGYAVVRLGEIAKIKNGKDYKALGRGNIPVYGSGGIMTYVDKSVYNKPTVLIPRKGSLANLFYVDTDFWNVDTIFYTEINQEIVVPKYLFYLLQKEHLENLNKAGGVPSLTQEILNKVVLLVPSCNEQERIVKILDRFDSLCNDISSGLPAEIEARKKQYEYYRDKLLTFERNV